MKPFRLILPTALATLAVLPALAHADVDLVTRADGPTGERADSNAITADASTDGRYVVFHSDASNLTEPDVHSLERVYRRDVATGRTTLVSRDPDGSRMAFDTQAPSISGDGRYVAFAKAALGEGEEWGDCYVRDVQAQTTTVVAVSNGCRWPELSANGRVLTFIRQGEDGRRAYAHDLSTGETELVSPLEAEHASPSGDGRYVVFDRGYTFEPDRQVYVRDRAAQTTQLVSRASGSAGAAADAGAWGAKISDDGHAVAFESFAANLAGGDGVHKAIFERDLADDATLLVSRRTGVDGAAASDDALGAGISADGRYVGFTTAAVNLGGPTFLQRAYVRDTLAGTTETVEVPGAETDVSSSVLVAGGGAMLLNARTAAGDDTAGFRSTLPPAAPVELPALSTGPADAAEGAFGTGTTAHVTVSLSRAFARPVSVRYATADGTARASDDYRAATGRLVIPAGRQAGTIDVAVLGDDVREGDETFTVTLSDPSRATLADATATVTIGDDDAGSEAPGGEPLPPVVPPRPSCDVRVSAGFARLRGCFTTAAGVSSAKGVVALNGLEIFPLDDATEVRVAADPRGAGHIVDSSGRVRIMAGDIQVFEDRLRLELPGTTGRTSVEAGMLIPPLGAGAYGLPFDDAIKLELQRDGGAKLGAKLGVPFSSLWKISVDATFVTDPDKGLKRNEIHAHKDEFALGPLAVKSLDLRMDGTNQTWSAEAKVELPTPNKVTLGAGMAFDRFGFKSAYGEVDRLGVPLAPGVALERIKFSIGVRPLALGGGIGISSGPAVAGQTAVRVDGNFSYTFSDPGKLHVDGSLKLAGVKLATAFFDYLTSGSLTFGGHLALGFPDFNAQDPATQPVYVEADLAGWIDGKRGFTVEAAAQAVVLGTHVGIELLGSDRGLAGCGRIEFFRGGFGYSWDSGKLTLMGPFACDVGPWRTTPDAGASQVGERAIDLPEGVSVLRLTGRDAVPDVTLTGPGGETVSTAGPRRDDRFVVLRDPSTKAAYVAIHHGRGRWHLTGDAAAVVSAGLLPPARVTAAVKGRTLRWSMTPRRGQRVTFAEIGPGTHRILGRTTRRRGALRFSPGAGPGGTRRIVALVEQDGMPRDQLKVTTYRAPAPPRLGRPSGLRVSGRGNALTVRWRGARGPVAGYLVEARVKHGPTLQIAVGARARRATLRAIAKIGAAQVTVRARTRAGTDGPKASRAL